jgi:hypothetical protein
VGKVFFVLFVRVWNDVRGLSGATYDVVLDPKWPGINLVLAIRPVAAPVQQSSMVYLTTLACCDSMLVCYSLHPLRSDLFHVLAAYRDNGLAHAGI